MIVDGQAHIIRVRKRQGALAAVAQSLLCSEAPGKVQREQPMMLKTHSQSHMHMQGLPAVPRVCCAENCPEGPIMPNPTPITATCMRRDRPRQGTGHRAEQMREGITSGGAEPAGQ